MSTRLKKVQGKKKRDTAARDAAQSAMEETTTEQEAEITTDMLRSKDEDIIF
jgi:V-type H+-transporting ATPase subunit D